MGIVIGLDAASGREEWRHDPGVADDAIPYGATCRGVAYYAVPDAPADELCATRIIWGTLDARIIAVDAKTGQICTDFGTSGEVNLETGLGDTVPGWYAVTSPPTIVRGVVVIGAQVRDGQDENAPSGVVRGYDAITGEFLWAWDLGNPGVTSEPPEGEVYTRGTPNMWTIASGDEELGHVYLPLGNSSVDYYGSNRSALENEYATSLVAVDVTTGLDVWHFRTVNNDVWDYDLGSQATLVDFPGRGRRRVPALVLPSKQGDIYVLDRRTGEPLTGVEQRETPRGGVEPDYLAPTQPFSLYHTLAKRDLTEADMWGMTPIDQLWCRIQFRQAAYERHLHAAHHRPALDPVPGLQRRLGLGRHRHRSRARRHRRQLQRHAQLQPAADARGGRRSAACRRSTRPAAQARRAAHRPARPMPSRSMPAGGRSGPGFSARSRPMAASAPSSSRPARRFGTSRSARRARTGRSASRACCLSTSARPTTAARCSPPAD